MADEIAAEELLKIQVQWEGVLVYIVYTCSVNKLKWRQCSSLFRQLTVTCTVIQRASREKLSPIIKSLLLSRNTRYETVQNWQCCPLLFYLPDAEFVGLAAANFGDILLIVSFVCTVTWTMHCSW